MLRGTGIDRALGKKERLRKRQAEIERASERAMRAMGGIESLAH